MSICFDMNPFTLNANPKKKKKNHVMFIFVFAGHVKHCHFLNVRITHITTLPKKKKKNWKQRVFFFLDICWKHCPSKPKKYFHIAVLQPPSPHFCALADHVILRPNAQQVAISNNTYPP